MKPVQTAASLGQQCFRVCSQFPYSLCVSKPRIQVLFLSSSAHPSQQGPKIAPCEWRRLHSTTEDTSFDLKKRLFPAAAQSQRCVRCRSEIHSYVAINARTRPLSYMEEHSLHRSSTYKSSPPESKIPCCRLATAASAVSMLQIRTCA